MSDRPSLKDLAQSRARLYERIGKIKAELATLDITIPADSGEEPPVAVVAPDEANLRVQSALREERDALRKAVKAAEEALEESESARAALLEEKVRLRRAVEDARTETEQATMAREAAEAKIERSRTRIEAALQEQDRVRQDLEARLAATEDELVRANSLLERRASDITRLEGTIAKLQNDLIQKVEVAQDGQKTLERFQETLAERSDRIAELESEVAACAALKPRVETLTAQNAELQAKLSRADRLRSDAEARVEDLQHRLTQEEQLARNLGEAHAEVQVLTVELEKQRMALDAMERERDKLVMLREASKKRAQCLEAEKQALQDELTRTAENLVEVKRLIKMMEEAGL